jgi:hypothetical protein
MNLGFHYSRNSDHPKKTYEYLTRAAFDMVGSDHGNLDEGVGLIQTAAANASNSKDILALLGVVSKGLQRLKKEVRPTARTVHIQCTVYACYCIQSLFQSCLHHISVSFYNIISVSSLAAVHQQPPLSPFQSGEEEEGEERELEERQ